MLNAKKFIGAAVFVLLSFTSGNAWSQTDDHGDTTDTATVLTPDTPETGTIEAGGDRGSFSSRDYRPYSTNNIHNRIA